MPASATTSAGLLIGLLADETVPDPARGHPVAVFGSVASALERRIWADARAAGIAYALACTGSAAALGLAVDRATRGRPPAAVLTMAACTWAVVGQSALAREATALRRCLASGDLPGARARLPRLCGRDPAGLDGTELARAAIESVAENTADALVAPLLWGALCGPAGLLGYRAVNTLDAMVGHRGARYGRFGWAAARLDDAATWVPARVTALLTVAAAPAVGGSVRRAWTVVRRDGGRHPSPNAGRCEAAAAGALGLRLGGANRYAHGTEDRGELGEGPAPWPADISRAVRLCRVAGAGGAAVSVALAAVVSRACAGVPWRHRGARAWTPRGEGRRVL